MDTHDKRLVDRVVDGLWGDLFNRWDEEHGGDLAGFCATVAEQTVRRELEKWLAND